MTRSTPRVRPAAFAGRWYPGTHASLAGAVDGYLAAASRDAVAEPGDVRALVSPHAGLVYSGPVAAHGYARVAGSSFDIVVLVGPSHYADFEGVALTRGVFETPLGPLAVDEGLVDDVLRALPQASEEPGIHAREHSLELQLPFLARVLPRAAILPIVMGHQRRATIEALASVLARVLAGRRALLVASSDLSHYHDAGTAARLDAVVLTHLEQQDPDGLQLSLERRPDHACGGGPMVAVMRAARALGADRGHVLRYADSGDVSGDKSQVVGYVSAAFGTTRQADV